MEFPLITLLRRRAHLPQVHRESQSHKTLLFQPRARSSPVLAHLPMAGVGKGENPTLSNPGGPKAASSGKQGPGSTGPQGDPLCVPAGVRCPPASPRPEFSRLSAAQRTPAGTACRCWRGKRAVPGGWGPAKRLMEHSWASPPGPRRREAERARRLPRRWPLGCTAALLAWPCAQARPSRFPAR